MTEMPPGYQPGMDPKAAAKAAKAYAKATRPWYKKKRFVIPIGLVGLVVIFSALGGGGDNADPAASTDEATTAAAEEAAAPAADKTTEAPKPKAKPVKVSAADLLKEFEDNELAGDTKYEGKTLKVTGSVNKIDTDVWDDDKYILRIGTGSDYDILTVNCNGMSKKELATLTAGDEVTVIGKFDDGGDLGVELKKCALA